MGRRKTSYEPGMVDLVAEIAWTNPWFGTILGLVLLGGALINCWLHSSDTGIDSLSAHLISLLLVILGISGLLVSILGFLRDFVSRRWK
jgi:hypothetical protein